jgi:hypothetical protein
MRRQGPAVTIQTRYRSFFSGEFSSERCIIGQNNQGLCGRPLGAFNRTRLSEYKPQGMSIRAGSMCSGCRVALKEIMNRPSA